MNFYRKFTGDYMSDTGHLSLAEHGAYNLMLDHHYATEKPLPAGKKLYRLLRCETAEDRRAVDAVVEEFWTETPNGLVNNKALSEIERSDRRRKANKANGNKGGRPPKGDEMGDE